jgi:hypothetical protein
MADKEIFDLKKLSSLKKENLPKMGNYVCVLPAAPPGIEESDNKQVGLNYTGKPGDASGIYFSLFFQLGKWGWTIKKADEWVEVHPTHKEYYERTMSTKQMLESTIKTGLTSAAQAVADYELMSHDLRRYREVLGYFNDKDEHSLKAMFVDQVDVHTDFPGQPMSLRSIAPRWPTVIADFMRLKEEDTDIQKVEKDLEVSKAEAVILVTKNKLYLNWKKTFRKVALDRYNILSGQVEARKKTISEYKEWLKPYISRFKMTKIGTERPGMRRNYLESFADVTGSSTFDNQIRVFTWKVLRTAEFRKPASEIKPPGNFSVYPYDDYVRNKIILDTKSGLASDDFYPWLRNPRKYCSKCKKYFPAGTTVCSKCKSIRLEDKFLADEMIEGKDGILDRWKRRDMGLDPYEIYYLFLDYDINRMGIRLPNGELEDITFNIHTSIISQNILLVKLLELECRNREIELYIDEMLGVKTEDQREISDLVMEEFPGIYGKEPPKINEYRKQIEDIRKGLDSYTKFFKKINLPNFGKLRFFKPGSYEKDFRERMSKNYSPVAGANFSEVVNFLKSKMGVS